MPIFFKNTFEFRMEKHDIVFAFAKTSRTLNLLFQGIAWVFGCSKFIYPLRMGTNTWRFHQHEVMSSSVFDCVFLAFSAAILVFFKSPRLVMCQIPRCKRTTVNNGNTLPTSTGAGLLNHQQYQKQLFRWTLFSFKQLWTPTLRFFILDLFISEFCVVHKTTSTLLCKHGSCPGKKQTWCQPWKTRLLSMKSRLSNDGILMSCFMKSQYNWVPFHPLISPIYLKQPLGFA